MKAPMTIGELKNALSEYDDNDYVVVEIHEGERHEDLYDFSIDVIDGVKLIDGGTRREIRFCI